MQISPLSYMPSVNFSSGINKQEGVSACYEKVAGRNDALRYLKQAQDLEAEMQVTSQKVLAKADDVKQKIKEVHSEVVNIYNQVQAGVYDGNAIIDENGNLLEYDENGELARTSSFKYIGDGSHLELQVKELVEDGGYFDIYNFEDGKFSYVKNFFQDKQYGSSYDEAFYFKGDKLIKYDNGVVYSFQRGKSMQEQMFFDFNNGEATIHMKKWHQGHPFGSSFESCVSLHSNKKVQIGYKNTGGIISTEATLFQQDGQDSKLVVNEVVEYGQDMSEKSCRRDCSDYIIKKNDDEWV